MMIGKFNFDDGYDNWYYECDYIDTDYDPYERSLEYDYDEYNLEDNDYEYFNYLKELENVAKLCPFDNGKATMCDGLKLTSTDSERFALECTKCGCSTPWCKSPEEALKIWNTRV